MCRKGETVSVARSLQAGDLELGTCLAWQTAAGAQPYSGLLLAALLSCSSEYSFCSTPCSRHVSKSAAEPVVLYRTKTKQIAQRACNLARSRDVSAAGTAQPEAVHPPVSPAVAAAVNSHH